MPIKKVDHRVKMVKKGDNKMALKWVPSSFDEPDLKKAKRRAFFQQRRRSSSPASSEGWLGERGDGPDGEGEDLRASMTVDQTALLESFNSTRQRALQATDADVEGDIVELSRGTAALEERGRRFMPGERCTMAAMDAVRETNQQNTMRVANNPLL
jgi:hypothetical protein